MAKTLRVLYVEDNDELRETIGCMLEGDAREIVSVATGEQALAACAAGPFDVLVTDVSLPGMSGTDLARRAVAEGFARWIVLCTGYALQHGVAAIGPNVRALTKPFEIEELEALMEEFESDVRRGGAAA